MSFKRKSTEGEFQEIKRGRWNSFETPTQMKVQYFPAVVSLQRIGKLLQFSKDTMKRLHRRCYAQPDVAHRMFEQFKKYLAEMERRTTQQIPKEQLREYFGGDHPKDVVIKGSRMN